MPFVRRDTNGKIIAVSKEQEALFVEELDKEDPEYQAFVVSLGQQKSEMVESDLDFVRVVEDLVELLVAKNVIRFTDLPAKAQAKFAKRQSLRRNMSDRLDLLSDEDHLL